MKNLKTYMPYSALKKTYLRNDETL